MIQRILSCIVLLAALFTDVHAVDWAQVTAEIARSGKAQGLIPLSAGGMTNEAFLYNCEEGTFFVKRAAPSADSIGASLDTEYHALLEGYAAGVAPKPVFCDVANGVLVMEFLDGYSEVTSIKSGKALLQVLELARSLHRSQGAAMAKQFDPLSTARAHFELAVALNPSRYTAVQQTALPILDRLEKALQGSWDYRPCHLDLWHKNVMVKEDHMVLIDWEYAALCDPLYELANFASSDRMSRAEVDSMLEVYLQRKAADEEVRRLYCHCVLANLRWMAWSAVQAELSPLDCPFDEWVQEYTVLVAHWQAILGQDLGADECVAYSEIGSKRWTKI